MVLHSDRAEPPRKRVKAAVKSTAEASGSKSRPRQKLFAPFRALGLITNHVPFALQLRSYKGATDGPRIHLLTCLGRSWALWEGGRMSLLFVSQDAPDEISCLAMDGDAVWAASGPHAIKYIRGKEVLRLTNPLATSLASITIFGSQILALTTDGTRLLTWDSTTSEFEGEIEFEPDFTATHVLHPATYINKVVVGSAQGGLQLWNVRSRTCIHKFSTASLTGSATTSAVTCLAQSPAIDVLGIGFASGEVALYDVRSDERLMRVFVREGGVRALAFRSDGHPVLATASEAGHISLWDLNAGGRLLHTVRGAHDGGITALEWVAGQPVLISSGEDNSIKQWLFDSPTAPPRLLKFRAGHAAPPHLIRFYGEDGKQLLTAARDRALRCTSVVRDSRSFELSQGSLAKKATSLSIPLTSLKLPPVATLSWSGTRSRDWDDVLTAHTDEPFARTWSVQNKRKGAHSFNLADLASKEGKHKLEGVVKSVCVSACGNFGIAGTSSGAIGMWNMQSGMHRRTFVLGPPPTGKRRKIAAAGDRPVTGVATDALNRTLVAATLDGMLSFFDFHTGKLEDTLLLPAAVEAIQLSRENGLLAATCDDLVVRLVDIETRQIVREFGGFGGRILDLTFSPDNRWLVTTSLDALVRTFDVPSGALVDVFRPASVATSIAFSPAGDLLATSHVDSRGVFLWANRAQFTDVPLRSISVDEVQSLKESVLPSMRAEEVGEDDDDDEELQLLTAEDLEAADGMGAGLAPALEDYGQLVTLTHLPRARWQTLLNLDVIAARNKPREPPKAPERAPFFLPSLPGVEHRFAVDEKQGDRKKEANVRRIDKLHASRDSIFVQKMFKDDEDDYEGLFDYLKGLSPAALDLELRSLTTISELSRCMRVLAARLRARRDFEAVQALIAVFVRAHGEVLVSEGELRTELEALLVAQKEESRRVRELVDASLGMLAFVRDTI